MLGVAALEDIDQGANLVGAAPADSKVFASVRVYDGVDAADQSEIARVTAAGFLPIMRESDGFVGYYLLPAGDQLAAISLFDSPEQAAASNERRGASWRRIWRRCCRMRRRLEGTVEVSTQLMLCQLIQTTLACRSTRAW